MRVELWQEAERVLLSPRLDDKLRFAPDWSDESPRLRAAPPAPGRPDELRFADASVPFPKGELESTDARRSALHFFANHELLALEIMALVLLRFPEAPPALRRALAVTLQEEQHHLRLYVERIRALGGDFGEAPVNGFFWRCFRELSSLEAYFAGMSLTFEQANLDFSAEFRDRFAAAGDADTAALMQSVLDDEIRHVRLGRIWLGKQARASDLWQTYVDSLPPPLTPRRARGRRMELDARRAAGLPDRFVERVALASQSRGRVPDAWFFGPMDQSGVAQRVAADLAPLAAVLAPADDLVHVPRMPSMAVRRAWLRAGLEPRELHSAANDVRARRWRGWGVSPPPGFSFDEAPRPAPPWATKRFGLRVARALRAETRSALLAAPGRWCESWAEVEGATFALSPDEARWKSPCGVAGRGQRRVQTVGPSDRRWAETMLRREGALLVEPQQDVLLELSLDPRGGEPLIAHVDPAGRFLGHALQSAAPALARLFGRRTELVLTLLRTAERAVAEALDADGHRDLAGIDALVVRRRSGELALRLPSEVNVRPSFGHVARSLKRKLDPSARAAHFIVSRADARRAGYPNLSALAEAHSSSLAAPPWRHGLLWTTDPQDAHHAGLLVVGREAPSQHRAAHPLFDWLPTPPNRP